MPATEGEFIPARKNKLGAALLTKVLITPSLRRQFHAIYLSADPATLRHLRGTPPSQRPPLVFASAHPSWWDGYLAWLVSTAFGKRDGYLMQDVMHLRQFRFFTWGGVFSVDRANPRSALRSIEYITDILNSGPNKMLWMFPHGTITNPDRRPLAFFPGIAHIVRRLDTVDLVPVVWRLEYRLEQSAEVFCRVGAPQRYSKADQPPSREIARRLAAAMEAEDDALRDLLIKTDPKDVPLGYRLLLQGRQSTQRNWEAVLEKARAVLLR